MAQFSAIIRPRTAKDLSDALNFPYEHVVFAHKSLTVKDLETAGEALGRNPNVQYLNLSDVRAGHLGARALAKGLKSNRSIIDFAFNYNFIGDEGAVALANALKNNPTLKYLSLTRCNIRGEGGVALAKGIPYSQIVYIDLGDNKIADPGAIAFANVLANESMLVDLDFTNNRMGSTGITSLANALESNSTLTKLGLRDNHCGVQGGAALGKMLMNNSTLKRLNLQCCGLGDQGAVELSKGLRVNQSLVQLSLRTNTIGGTGTSGVEALAEAMRTNTSLLTLRLSSNFLNNDHAVILEKLFEDNQNLTKLSLLDTRINIDHAARIDARLQQNVERQKAAFLEALDGKEKTAWGRSKLMLIGEGMAGKSATVRSLLDQPFNPEWDSTIGVDITETRTTKTTWVEDAQEDIAVEFIAKIALKRMEKVGSKSKARKKRASTSALGKAQRLSQKAIAHIKSVRVKHPPTAAVIPQEREEDAGREVNINVETPSKLDKFFGKARTAEGHIRLSIWDYGGQVVFHNLHHLFLTHYGVYLLIVNMKTLLQQPQQARKHLEFWLKAVQLHSPSAPLLITGTFLDQVEPRLQEIEQFMQELLSGGYPQVVVNRDKGLRFYPIDNKSKNGLGELRKCIEVVTNAQDFVHIQVSVQWCLVLDSLLQKNKSWVRLTEVKVVAEENGVKSSVELYEMLSLFHQLGMLLYFDATQILQDIVTIRPQWLIDAFSKVIRDRALHGFDENDMEEVGLRVDAERLFTEGVVTRDLLIHLWDGYQVEFLLELMRSLMLLSWWSFGEGEEKYLVPSMIPRAKTPPEMQGIRCNLRFKFLPNGVFERLLCLLVDYSSKQQSLGEPSLSLNAAQVWLRKDVLVSLTREHELLSVYFDCQGAEPPPLAAVLAMLTKLNGDVWRDALRWEVSVEVNDSMVALKDAKRERMKPWFISQVQEGPADNVNIRSFLETF